MRASEILKKAQEGGTITSSEADEILSIIEVLRREKSQYQVWGRKLAKQLIDVKKELRQAKDDIETVKASKIGYREIMLIRSRQVNALTRFISHIINSPETYNYIDIREDSERVLKEVKSIESDNA